MNKILTRVLLLAVLAGGIGWAALHREALNAAAVEQWVHGFGVWGPLVFMVIYAVAAVLFLPGSALTLAGGALFGPVWGTIYNLVGATVGATLSFLIARYAASDWVARKTGGRLKQLLDGVEREGWKFVAFVRLVPLFPFNLLNYALGLTRIRLRDYVLASLVCMAPGGFAYTYLGYAGREAVGGGEGLMQKALLALGLLAVVAFLPSFVQKMRRGAAPSPGGEDRPS
ncbi:MAG: TVP38/TMEM64 family protein [Magnetococcales bacterium]|nr:TVP38/TMEM64 family protein [Magnetococcales bacterium]